MAFTLCYQAFSPAYGDEHFRRAREIFASLTGILGTIVGFHFGITDKPGESVVVNGRLEGTRVVAHVSGGKAPYTFSVDSTQTGLVGKKKDQDVKDDWISLEVVPQKVAGKVSLQVKDQSGQIKEQVIEVPAQADPPPAPPPGNG